ncbi:phage terminase large subunit family protein [Verminephrobacter aporrectodeae subsp. tuberculatae]|uniref:Phage terminase large subunit family protein n=1 Tax=Verminephrobacter aporrectodeae subsp. tuberculatae TaxID=1110392 RepID=A0ABT3KNW6_9BURK|nr:phage terminase large subunit family protein [Verminephrobacter aporrectodeae]MCW5319639.1 phage terminase large subunit family protein [Verminephrobacter aporrectodeae subsp. tuberculatae]
MMKMLNEALRRAAARAAPPPKITIRQWADRCLYLSSEDSAEQGKYSSARAPYQRGIMDAFNEEGVEEITMMSSAQVGKTLILKAVIGFYIDVDPSPILVVQPTVEMAETFSKDRLAPMIRDTPVLRGKVADAKSRDSGNTIQRKNFTGGHITMVGANAPAGLASRPIRIVLCDEVDRYPASAGTEGDPVNLARKRTITFRSRKRVALFSTPTVKGVSRIERAWIRSDQRRYYVPCPHCGDAHVLRWENISIIDDDPSTARMSCPACGGLIQDAHKPAMLEAGQWVKENPASKLPGFHINELYSPWRRFSEIAAAYYAAKGNPEEEKTWWNTSMGESYEGDGERADADELAKRRENYDRDTVPDGVLTVTAGVDTQQDRLEVEFIGWGAGEESWGIEHTVLNGNPAEPEIWERLDELLATARFTTGDGRVLRVAACCIDSGGHHVQQVYEYATPRAARNIWAVKGQSGARPVWPKRLTKSKRYRGHTVRMIGVDTAKDTVYSRWQVSEGRPGYCHFSMAYTGDWFAQATVERRVTKFDRRGTEVRSWEKPSGARNEALDCRVYAYSALQGMKVERRLVLARRTGQAMDAEPQPKPPIQPIPAGKPQPKPEPAKPVRAAQIPVRRVSYSSYLRRR